MATDSSSKKLTKKERRALKKKEKMEKREQEKKKQGMGKALGWTITLVAIAVAIWGIMQVGKQTTPSVISDIPVDQIVASDQTKGATESAVLLVEYSDFQCPACAQYYPIIQELVEQSGDEFTFVYRHFPLRQIHANAQLAAQAAEAAGRQGMFWEMHDILFDNQASWSDENDPTDTFVGYADELGLDTDQFRNDLRAQEITDKVNNDFISGQAAGVNSTPTFYLNGQRLSNMTSVEDFQDAIRQIAPNDSAQVQTEESMDEEISQDDDTETNDQPQNEMNQEDIEYLIDNVPATNNSN